MPLMKSGPLGLLSPLAILLSVHGRQPERLDALAAGKFLHMS
jgi:hypothetical protein